uniref:Immunoglobulin domain-containing protein n=1 Tax=Anas platyrhynchos TaxID=8839 RepID=A0A8B9SXG3_ANAPL
MLYSLISLEKAFLLFLAGIVEQSPLVVDIQQGQSLNITCALNSSYKDEEICLLKTHKQPEGVLCVSSQKALEIFPVFANRLEYSKEEKKLVITLHNLQQSDNDVYVCAAVLNNSFLFSVSQRGTMVMVKGIVLLESLGRCSRSSGSYTTRGEFKNRKLAIIPHLHLGKKKYKINNIYFYVYIYIYT